MKLLIISFTLIICFLLIPETLISQNQDDNIITIEEVYNNLIPNEISSTKNFINPTTNYKLIKTNQEVSILNNTIISDVIKDFKSEWEYIIFNEVTINEVEKDNILVTGIISGKKIEQGIVNHQYFQHTWLIQNGIVVKFLN